MHTLANQYYSCGDYLAYNILLLVIDEHVHLEIKKDMYGLPQATRIAHDQLKHHITLYDYTSTTLTPGLWCHLSRPITFALVLDDFGIKSVGTHHTNHLINALRELYAITTDSIPSIYCNTALERNYIDYYVDVSMLGYVAKALYKF